MLGIKYFIEPFICKGTHSFLYCSMTWTKKEVLSKFASDTKLERLAKELENKKNEPNVFYEVERLVGTKKLKCNGTNKITPYI